MLILLISHFRLDNLIVIKDVACDQVFENSKLAREGAKHQKAQQNEVSANLKDHARDAPIVNENVFVQNKQ